MASTQTGVIFVDKKGLYFYTSILTSPLFFEFPPANVINLDVIHEEKLEEKIQAFIVQNQLSPTSVIMVLAESTYFEKDFIDIPPDQQETAKRAYMDNVPFELIDTKSYPLPNGFKLVVVNKQLCDVLKRSFEKKGFGIEGITPVLVLGPLAPLTDMPSLQTLLITMISKFALLKQNAFSLQQIKQQALPSSSPFRRDEPKENNNKKIIFLGLVFSVLLLFLGYMLFWQ